MTRERDVEERVEEGESAGQVKVDQIASRVDDKAADTSRSKSVVSVPAWTRIHVLSLRKYLVLTLVVQWRIQSLGDGSAKNMGSIWTLMEEVGKWIRRRCGEVGSLQKLIKSTF